MNGNASQQPEPAASFRETHCVKCQAGWVRATTEKSAVVICLLNREPVPGNLTACNKYQPEGI